MSIQYKFNSLSDYLASTPLNVNCVFNDGWNAHYPVKGREIEATILFADIANFSGRTSEMTSTETLAYANNFFCWMTAEALRGSHGIVDKYIGDEMMIVYSKEFGSEDPFLEAILAARSMLEHDTLNFRPRVGIASGVVTVGYVGTPVRYDCSVFGRAVSLAARCASHRPDKSEFSTSINFLESEWAGRKFEEIFRNERIVVEDDEFEEMIHGFELLDAKEVTFKNCGPMTVRSIVNTMMRILNFSVEDRLRTALTQMNQRNQYFPLFDEPKNVVRETLATLKTK